MRSAKAVEQFDGIIEHITIEPTGNGPLSGLSFAVKDLFDLKGRVTGFGTPAWAATHSAAQENAKCVDDLLQAGARLVAVTCSDELACSLDGINIHFGTPVNPQMPDRIPGGSSSGSASTVAAGLVDFALGTDTAGSVRVPSSYCGVYGYRPTHGLIPIEGVLPLGPSFDVVGVFARSAIILEEVAATLINGQHKKAVRPNRLLLPIDCYSILHPDLVPHMMAKVEHLKLKFDVVEEADLYAKGRHC